LKALICIYTQLRTGTGTCSTKDNGVESHNQSFKHTIRNKLSLLFTLSYTELFERDATPSFKSESIDIQSFMSEVLFILPLSPKGMSGLILTVNMLCGSNVVSNPLKQISPYLLVLYIYHQSIPNTHPKTLRKVCTCQKLKFSFLLLEYCKIRECYAVANAFTIRNMYSLFLYMKCNSRKINRLTKNMTKIVTLLQIATISLTYCFEVALTTIALTQSVNVLYARNTWGKKQNGILCDEWILWRNIFNVLTYIKIRIRYII
jgi:hypothetical protein